MLVDPSSLRGYTPETHGEAQYASKISAIELKALEGGRFDVVVEDRIDLVDHISIDFQKAALVLGGDQGAASAIVHHSLQWLEECTSAIQQVVVDRRRVCVRLRCRGSVHRFGIGEASHPTRHLVAYLFMIAWFLGFRGASICDRSAGPHPVCEKRSYQIQSPAPSPRHFLLQAGPLLLTEHIPISTLFAQYRSDQSP